ncbi:MAG: hypothetical protein ACT4QA_16100 [Panacagrimonas sp.]
MNSDWYRVSLFALSLLTATVAAAEAIVMSTEEQARMGVVVAAAARVERPDERPGYGRVLDIAPLAVLDAELVAAEAMTSASAADAARSEALFRAGENASRRQWETAQASARADAARLDALRLRLALEWGQPIAALSATQRANLIAGIARGRASLIRAAAPGFVPDRTQAVGAALRLPVGEPKPLRVLGQAANADPLIPGTAFLVMAEGVALQAGAPVSIGLSSDRVSGVQVPAAALLADRQGMSAYVRVKADAERFERVWVHVLLDEGDTVLVRGLPDNAQVVTVNAAALHWLAKAPSREMAEDDDD